MNLMLYPELKETTMTFAEIVNLLLQMSEEELESLNDQEIIDSFIL